MKFEDIYTAHVIEFRQHEWAIEHAPECREDGKSLLDCPMHKLMSTSGWIFQPAPGRYPAQIFEGELQLGGPL